MNIKPIRITNNLNKIKLNLEPSNINNLNNSKTTNINTTSSNNEIEDLYFPVDEAPNITNINLNNTTTPPELPLYGYDENGAISLNRPHPKLTQKMTELVELSEKEGIPIRVTETVRTVKRQNKLYNKGRDDEGNIIKKEKVVTNAKGEDYSSLHQWGIAFDICIDEKGSEYDEEKLKKVGELGKSIGLEWGGDWTTFEDTPHFQLKGYGSSVQVLKDEYQNPGNFADTWNN